jgi:NAD(P)-dependent dehydrogenase (short-subunit alcohol dehydrogenase family)
VTPVAVVTGAAGGIGAAVCERLRTDGWRAVGLDTGFSERRGDERFADVADRESLRSALEDVARIDGVVSNAAIMTRGPLVNMSPDNWTRTIDVNLSATFHLIGLTHQRLAATQGAIVAVSSVHALATSPGAGAYAASKAGLLGLVRAASLELADEGIRVNAVLPGATDTPMLRQDGPGFDALLARTPLGRVAEPAEIADAVAFLLGGSARFVTGQTLVVDGGVLGKLASE